MWSRNALEKRLARGDRGINPLDEACRIHDIAYRDNTDLTARHRADRDLAERDLQRVRSKDAGFGEKAAAWTVTNLMKAKTKFGMGCGSTKRNNKKKTRKTKKQRLVAFKGGFLKRLINTLKTDNGDGSGNLIKRALAVAKNIVKSIGGKRNVSVPRALPLPKEGGFLPFLIPLFAGLSAAGALAGGASGIAKAVNDAKAAKRQLDENTRHNRSMEAIALGKQGSGLFLKRTAKNGNPLFPNP